MKKIRTVCIDTLTGIQNEIFMTESKKPNYDQWMDFGKDIWRLASYLQDKGFELIYILGEPGTGKSTGMRTLEPDTNIWINTDNKNPIWEGGREEYGSKSSPRLPYHIIPKTYSEITNHINKVEEKVGFEDIKFAFLMGHIEDYKSGMDNKKRLKVLGKVATKMQLEGKAETVLYAEIRKNTEGENEYVLTTENSGFDTARSPMGQFEPIISNDYGFIVNKLINFYK